MAKTMFGGKGVLRVARIHWLTDIAPSSLIQLSQPDQQMPTVKGYLTGWLETYAKVHCKSSTAAGYRLVCEKHLFPALGERLLYDVSRFHQAL